MWKGGLSVLRKGGVNTECFFTFPFPHAPICTILKSLSGGGGTFCFDQKSHCFKEGKIPDDFLCGCAWKEHNKMGQIKFSISDCRNKKTKELKSVRKV